MLTVVVYHARAACFVFTCFLLPWLRYTLARAVTFVLVTEAGTRVLLY